MFISSTRLAVCYACFDLVSASLTKRTDMLVIPAHVDGDTGEVAWRRARRNEEVGEILDDKTYRVSFCVNLILSCGEILDGKTQG